jgi:hypothetical protein
MKPIRAPAFGTLLLYGAAAFQATQYARAFHNIDSSSLWADAGGILAGIVVNGGLAYSASRLPRLSGKRQRLAYLAFGSLVIITPLFLAPINYKTMGDLWIEAPLARWTLAALSASVVDLAIALVAFSNGSLMSLPATLSDAASHGQRRSATSSHRSAAKRAGSIYRCECGYQSTDRFVMSGHKGRCATHLQLKAGAPIPIDLSASDKGRANK